MPSAVCDGTVTALYLVTNNENQVDINEARPGTAVIRQHNFPGIRVKERRFTKGNVLFVRTV